MVLYSNDLNRKTRLVLNPVNNDCSQAVQKPNASIAMVNTECLLAKNVNQCKVYDIQILM